MRTLDLFPDRQRGVLVEALTSSVKVTTIEGFQNDTLKLRVHGGLRKKRPDETLTTAPYVEEAWTFDSLRASITVLNSAGSVDVAPERGSFKLRVDGQTTPALEWPTPADEVAGFTATEIATFKAAVLAALRALSNIADGDIEAADPVGAPIHTLYFAWTNSADTRAIEIVDVLLQPPVAAEVGAVQSSPYVQFVKLTQLPIVTVEEFEFPEAESAAISSERAGGAGVNEVQLLTIPADGAFDLTWSGARTAVLSCSGLTAAIVASALNAIVTDGDTTPSFSVSARSSRVFAIEFIGPLAAADQALLLATMRQSASSLVAEASMALTSRRFERALNGASKVTLRFELVIDSAENTFQADFLLLNDATGPGTLASVEEQLAIVTKTETVYVPSDTLEAFVTASAGFSYTPATALSAGVHQSITHNLGTQDINVVVLYADPASPFSGKKRRLDETEVEFRATGDNTAEIWLAFAITSDGGDFDKAKFKVYVSALDATLQLVGGIEITSDQVTYDDSTLTAKIAALEAALGMLGGALKVNVTQLVGLITATQIDMTSFVNALTTAITNNATLSAAWLKMIQAAIVDPATLTKLITALGAAPNMIDLLRKLVLDALGGALADGSLVTASGIPAETLEWPPSAIFLGPEITKIVPATIEEVSGGITTTYPGTKEIKERANIEIFAPLFLASPVSGSITGEDITGAVTLTPDTLIPVGTFTANATANTLTKGSDHKLQIGDCVVAGETLDGITAGVKLYVIASGFTSTTIKVSLTPGGSVLDITGSGSHTLSHLAAYSEGRLFPIWGDDVVIAAHAGIDRIECNNGDAVTFVNDHWTRVYSDGTNYYDAELARTLFQVLRSAASLPNNAKLEIAFGVLATIASVENDLTARARLSIDTATPATGALLESIDYSAGTRAAITIDLDATPQLIRGVVSITRDGEGALSGSVTLGGTTATWTPTTGNFAIRLRVDRVDCGPNPSADPLSLYGKFTFAVQDPVLRIVAI